MTSTPSVDLAAEGYPPLLLAADLCRVLRIHENTLYRRIKAGSVPSWRTSGTGRRVRYEWLRADVERWLTHQRAGLRRAG